MRAKIIRVKALVCAVLAVSGVISQEVFAEGDYVLTFHNKTKSDITVRVADSECMHNPGPSEVKVPANGSADPIKMEDSNNLGTTQKTCTNAAKTVTWNVSGRSGQLVFNHYRHDGWHTYFQGTPNTTANCNSKKSVNCFAPAQASNKDLGDIDVSFN